eukprot:g64166.t1
MRTPVDPLCCKSSPMIVPHPLTIPSPSPPPASYSTSHMMLATDTAQSLNQPSCHCQLQGARHDPKMINTDKKYATKVGCKVCNEFCML